MPVGCFLYRWSLGALETLSVVRQNTNNGWVDGFPLTDGQPPHPLFPTYTHARTPCQLRTEEADRAAATWEVPAKQLSVCATASAPMQQVGG